MLIATLPTLTSNASTALANRIIAHRLVGAVRYNTGGDSPYNPQIILQNLKYVTDVHKKTLYVDLEGRQIRVAKWSPYSNGTVTLNRDFDIELPGIIHFRGAGWFDIKNVKPAERKIYIKPRDTSREHYFGESQSVHIVAKNFAVKGYLGGLDKKYIKAASDLGLDNFMLSFVENEADIAEFVHEYFSSGRTDLPSFVAKIESRKGVDAVRSGSVSIARLMAARDDLFLAYVHNRHEFLDAVKLIIDTDPKAILASHIMSGLEQKGEVTPGDMADLALMRQYGYKSFMFSDGMAHHFDEAMEDWENIILPIISKN